MSYKLELTIADFAFTEYEFNGNQTEVINEILNKKGLDLNYSLKITDVEYNEYNAEAFKNHYYATLSINFDNKNELEYFLNQYQDRTEAYIFNIKQEEIIIANEVDHSKNTRKFKI